jgi:hypothetical protein
MPKRRFSGVWRRERFWGIYSLCRVPVGQCINVVRTRAALGTSRQVARVQTVLLTVRPVVAARVRMQIGPVRTIGLYSRPESKRVPSIPLFRPDTPH